jgi:hypothetical protein
MSMRNQNGDASTRSAPAPALIRSSLLDNDDGVDLGRLLPAWIISGVIHIVVLSLLLLIGVSRGVAGPDKEVASIVEASPEDSEKMANLTNDDIGNDPELKTNYNNDNIQEVSVPGPVNPGDVGYLNGSDTPPMTVAPPPGFGGGQGGGIEDPTSGTAMKSGFEGGMGGARGTLDVFKGRSGATREKMVKEGGGNTRSEAAVAAGLKWLSRHQANDGHWGLHDFHVAGHCNCAGPGTQNDPAGTGLGLLPFLAAGETHKGSGMYAKKVRDALTWIRNHQGADGSLGNGYAHPICTICLCEAYGLTADPDLRVPAQRAVNACVAWQENGGGFRYGPREAGDLSVTGWFIQALKSGQMAGLNVPGPTLGGINTYLDSVGTPSGDKYRYQAGNDPTPTMTAVGLLSRQYMGWGTKAPGLIKGLDVLNAQPPGKGYRNIYYYYYATQVQHNMGGDSWDKWNKDMRDMLVDGQDQGTTANKADQKGSWANDGDAWGSQMGRLGYTSLCLLTLEVYYRHLPLYRRELGSMKDMPVRNGL